MRAPAEMARLLTKATVVTGLRSKASRMITAASTRPPKVLMSRITAAAPSRAAVSSTRSTNGASPRSIMPSTGTTHTGPRLPSAPGDSADRTRSSAARAEM